MVASTSGTYPSSVEAPFIIWGAVAGTLLAAFIAFLWSRYGYRVNLSRFFQVTAVFLLVFVVQLVIYGFHELTESNLFPGSEALHFATEPYGPDGEYGQYLTYLLVVLPVGEFPNLGELPPVRPAVSWVATHVFRVSSPLVVTGSGSGDNTS